MTKKWTPIFLSPGGVMHSFENRSDKKAAVFNISIPGGFEKNMGMITEWYEENSPRRLESIEDK